MTQHTPDDVFDVAKAMLRAEWDGIGDINDADVDVEDLEIKVKNLEIKIKNLDIKIKNLDIKIKNLDIKMKNLDIKIKNLEIKVKNLEIKIKNLEIKVKNLEINTEDLDSTPKNLDVDAIFGEFDSKIGVNVCQVPPSNLSEKGDFVTRANSSGTARKNANNSRRAGLRSCGSDRDRRRSWGRPLRRTGRALDCVFRLIDSCQRVIEASERFAAERPVRATRQLELVWGWVVEAAEQLQCVGLGLSEAAERAAQSPELALDVPEKLVEATLGWVKATRELAALSDRLNDTFACLVASVTSGAIPIPLAEQTADAGEPVTTVKLIAKPLLPPDWFGYQRNEVPCIPLRRQRSVLLTVVEAARRVSRGRAPPFVSTCSL